MGAGVGAGEAATVGSALFAFGFINSGSASRSGARCWRFSFSPHSATVSWLRMLNIALMMVPAPTFSTNLPFFQIGFD
jgi:hypothetical protein